MKASIYSVQVGVEYLKIYINRVLHIAIKQEELVGFTSWIYGDSKYCIEFSFRKNGRILCEYDKRDKWEHILELLDSKL